jgi:hypothetical protein
MQAAALALQERSLHIDRLEAELYPDGEDSKRPPVSAGDDDFTADMKANGLKHTTTGKQELRLTAGDDKHSLISCACFFLFFFWYDANHS